MDSSLKCPGEKWSSMVSIRVSFILTNLKGRHSLFAGQLEQQTAKGRKAVVFFLQMNNKFYKEEVIAKC